MGENLRRLRLRIASAAALAGRDAASITVLAVSKGHGAETLRAALAAGLTAFGENYVDEALPKIQALREARPVWHFIGRPQANKTRTLAEQFDWVHGVDRPRIAERLSAQRPFHAPPLNLCVQVNVAGEATKGGVTPEQAPELLDAIAALPRLKLRGLMCMLPFDLSEPEQRAGFARLRALLEAAQARGHALDTLSMGMSDDFEAAIREGATLLRIGSALFGARG
ncbi:MAG: YggS family pyridoxal phosphate-dependent enzyme [Nevskiaceae bacterium]|nr:YggS family pyridoxal phosphate-dependent enzyme [Nevskiaceae bacterium]